MPRKEIFDWTEALSAQIVRLWNAPNHKSAEQIRVALNNPSINRNMIMGHISRLRKYHPEFNIESRPSPLKKAPDGAGYNRKLALTRQKREEEKAQKKRIKEMLKARDREAKGLPPIEPPAPPQPKPEHASAPLPVTVLTAADVIARRQAALAAAPPTPYGIPPANPHMATREIFTPPPEPPPSPPPPLPPPPVLTPMAKPIPPVRTCQWIIGDVRTKNWHFCDQAVDAGYPYCATHRNAAFTQRSDRQDTKQNQVT